LPVIVRNTTDQELVIGNFVDGPPNHEYLKRRKLFVLKDLGDGLVIYKKERLR
jgi:hypothetical protein